MNDKPKVSIITPTYNEVEHLKESLECILQQDYDNIECIVIDGGSKDTTVDYIKEIAPRFNERLKWISEPDKGIYDAINKGYKLATGDIIGCFFDKFTHNSVISKMVNAILSEGTDGVHSDLVYCSGNKIIRYWKMGQGTIRSGWMPGFPTFYLKRDVYEKYGLYKDSYKCSGDYEFMIRILKDNQVKLSYIPEVMVHMYYGGTSTSGLNAYWFSLKEAHRALRENKVHFALVIDFIRTIRVLLQFIIKK